MIQDRWYRFSLWIYLAVILLMLFVDVQEKSYWCIGLDVALLLIAVTFLLPLE